MFWDKDLVVISSVPNKVAVTKVTVTAFNLKSIAGFMVIACVPWWRFVYISSGYVFLQLLWLTTRGARKLPALKQNGQDGTASYCNATQYRMRCKENKVGWHKRFERCISLNLTWPITTLPKIVSVGRKTMAVSVYNLQSNLADGNRLTIKLAK